MQLETRVEHTWFQRVKLNYDRLLSSLAFNFNSRPFCKPASRVGLGWNFVGCTGVVNDESGGAWRILSPRHRMPFNSINEG